MKAPVLSRAISRLAEVRQVGRGAEGRLALAAGHLGEAGRREGARWSPGPAPLLPGVARPPPVLELSMHCATRIGGGLAVADRDRERRLGRIGARHDAAHEVAAEVVRQVVVRRRSPGRVREGVDGEAAGEGLVELRGTGLGRADRAAAQVEEHVVRRGQHPREHRVEEIDDREVRARRRRHRQIDRGRFAGQVAVDPVANWRSWSAEPPRGADAVGSRCRSFEVAAQRRVGATRPRNGFAAVGVQRDRSG